MLQISLKISFIILFQISLKTSSLCLALCSILYFYAASSITIPRTISYLATIIKLPMKVSYLMLVKPLKVLVSLSLSILNPEWEKNSLSFSHYSYQYIFYFFCIANQLNNFNFITHTHTHTHYSRIFPIYSPWIIPEYYIITKFQKLSLHNPHMAIIEA